MAAHQPIQKFFSKPDCRGSDRPAPSRETHQLRWGASPPTSMDGLPERKAIWTPTLGFEKNFSMGWVSTRGPPSVYPRPGYARVWGRLATLRDIAISARRRLRSPHAESMLRDAAYIHVDSAESMLHDIAYSARGRSGIRTPNPHPDQCPPEESSQVVLGPLAAQKGLTRISSSSFWAPL